MKEIWKDIKDYEGLYQVSNLARIKSSSKEAKPGKGNGARAEQFIKIQTSDFGYHFVELRKNGERKTCQLHRLIAQAFIPNTFNKREVNHISGNKVDNRIENLEWCTRSENMIHAHRTGLKSEKGEKNSRATLKDWMIPEIRSLWRTGKYMQKDIAKLYNTTPIVISKIITFRTWNHIK